VFIRIFFYAALMAMAMPASAQKTLRFVVPYGAGGAPDVMSRMLATKLSERNGHPVIVDNRPGSSSATRRS
jgi:tripartite-type tricarboxylate transporter receptor subunit TctC